MAAAYGVRLIACGPNRLGVLARVRPLLRLSPAEAKSRLAAGSVVLVTDVGRHAAERLAADLERLGAAAEVFVSTPCPSDTMAAAVAGPAPPPDLATFWGPPFPYGPEPPPVSPADVREWERRHAVRLPATLARALPVQNGGCVRGTPLVLFPLAEFVPLSDRRWDAAFEYQENQRFGNRAGLFWIGCDDQVGGRLVMNGNVEPEPAMLWLWPDLGDELRDEGDGTFDHLVHRRRAGRPGL